MTKVISNQYMLKQASKQQWYFFHHTNTGICFKKKLENEWSDYEILLKDGQGDFDIIIDPRDNIHLICQDKLGSIIYLMYNGQQWHKYVILQSKNNKAYPKYFKMLFVNGWINLFYVIQYKDKNLLVHHILDNNNVSPNVIDYIVTSARPFSVSAENSGNIHIYYQDNTDSNKIGYRVYMWSKKTWSDFISIDLENYDAVLPYIIIDHQDNIHLTYLKKSGKNYDIIYKRKPSNSYNKALWDKEVVVYNRCYEDAVPVIMKVDKQLLILWQQDIKVLSSSSDDDGITWRKPSQFMAGRYGNIGLFGFRIPASMDKDNIICDQCYGYNTNNDINLYIISNYLEQLPAAKPEPEFKMSGYEVEEFAEKHKNSFLFPSSNPSVPAASPAAAFLRSSTSQSNTGVDNSIESTKLKIMLNMLQEDLSQTKKKLLELSQFSRIDEDLKNIIDEQYRTEIEKLKVQFQQLLERIAQIEKIQDNIIRTELERINKEITIIKRNNNKTSFTDLIHKVEESKK
ncbi:hypothetical protein [Petroclostridium xylanilyticum]|uniref:hypothetical protein n=1 Tax=Petroclostridium xylanilyticum TaxID=1792311 RepID=UPI000B99B238|nr:hypothetical protein [Petroclostridium xylanilyticum]